jgi:hypothetical protein
MVDPLDFVTQRLVERYGHPARTAYLYMFRIKADSNFSLLIPESESIIAAWVDEGSGLALTKADEALERCGMTKSVKTVSEGPRKLTSHQRKQMMARSVQFSVVQSSPDLVEVHLMSRSLGFSPKGDRETHELWRPTGDGWYSAYKPEE